MHGVVVTAFTDVYSWFTMLYISVTHVMMIVKIPCVHRCVIYVSEFIANHHYDYIKNISITCTTGIAYSS